MNKNYPVSQFKNLLDQNSAAIIYLIQNPDFDQVAAALGLKLALEKQGKSVSVLSSASMLVEFSQLVGIDTIGQKNESGRNLVISLDYPLDQIEKVSYNDEGGKLNLVVEPKAGAPKVEKNQASFSYEGQANNLQIILGASDLSQLGDLAARVNNQNIVSIVRSGTRSLPGSLEILDQEASSYSEIIVGLLSGLNFAVDEDIASNLFLGLKRATGNFNQETVTAETFEAAAACFRWGAKQSFSFNLSSKVPISEEKPIPLKPRQANPEQAGKQDKAQSQAPVSAPSPDWLEPKIFKSSKI